uniref:Metalloendopeptidase n=1 Tax=Trichuris muris TaxID=70415 RepID=A0A5S6QKU0_TRIMR
MLTVMDYPCLQILALFVLTVCCKGIPTMAADNGRDAHGGDSMNLVGWCERMLTGSLRDACELELKLWCREMAQATSAGAVPKVCNAILANQRTTTKPQYTTAITVTTGAVAADVGTHGIQFAPTINHGKVAQLKTAFAKLSPRGHTPRIDSSQVISTADEPSAAQRTELEINGPDRLFMGDLQLTPFQWVTLMKYASRSGSHRPTTTAGPKAKRKAGEDPPFRHWEGSVIPYRLDESLREGSRTAVLKAIRLWQENTCLQWRERPRGQFAEGILFTENEHTCSSFVGKVGRVQNISVSWPQCATVGLVAHQMGHAIGLLHEQNRLDQERYLTVNFNNLNSNFRDLVARLHSDLLVDFDLPYDHGSVMHVAPVKNTKGNNNTAAVVTVDANYQWTIGQRKRPSFLDYKLVNMLYCADRCHAFLPCQRDGYEDVHDCTKCQCPSGLGGQFCERAEMQDGEELCGGELTAQRMDSSLKTPTDGSRRCSWLIRSAEPQGTVHLQFLHLNMSCEKPTCSGNFVEIKTGPRFDATGYRFCCNRLPPRNQFISVGPELLVIFESGGRSDSKFALRYRSVDREPQTTAVTTATPTTDSGGEMDTCPCAPWNQWSECTQECGGCGSQLRSRQCTNTKQPHCPTVQSRKCNFVPCEGSKMIVNNGEFHLLFNGCCVGMQLQSDGLCKPSAPITSILGSLLNIGQ